VGEEPGIPAGCFTDPTLSVGVWQKRIKSTGNGWLCRRFPAAGVKALFQTMVSRVVGIHFALHCCEGTQAVEAPLEAAYKARQIGKCRTIIQQSIVLGSRTFSVHCGILILFPLAT
jgi:hypothetical protein